MSQSLYFSSHILKEWQSSACMIPIVLDLLKEKLASLDKHNRPNSELFPEEIQAYQEAYQQWQNNPNLNPKQQEWMHEMRHYIQALQQTIFRQEKTSLSASPAQKAATLSL